MKIKPFQVIGTGLIIIGFISIVLSILGRGTYVSKDIFPILIIIGASILNIGISICHFFKQIERRKKIARRLLYLSIGLVLFGVIFKFFEIPGSNIILVFTCNFICFTYGPLAIKSRYEKWEKYSKTWHSSFFLSLGDLLGIVFLIMGWLFKIQHWPGYAFMMIFGGALLLLSILAWNNLFKKIVVRQKQTEYNLNEKHNLLKSALKEITDSIDYAKRIQNAILPPLRLVKTYFKESFILYKPKDIVAGDFYWMEHIGDTILFAAADCTGHGVPGAMVSVVCHNALNRAVREYNLTDPGEILDKVRTIVIEEFEKSDDDVKDGMDIALCALTGNHLQYAGAHNPLWIIRNKEILETKANKEPIGKFHHQSPFTTHSFELEKGDTIYIFSDGLVDQFGGEKEKKFKPAKLRKILLQVQNQPLLTQRISINEAFENWKGDLEQVDDVCMIGVRIS